MAHSSVARSVIKSGIILLLAQVFSASLLFAEEAEAPDRYQIEFILFKQASPDLSVLEYERVSSPITPSAPYLSLNPYSEHALSSTQRAKPKENYEQTLSETEERLLKKGYEVLAKGSWIEPMSKDSRSLPLRLSSAETGYDHPFWFSEWQISRLEQGNTDNEESDGESNEESTPDFREEHFYGELTLRRSRYLHAELRLDYYFKEPVFYKNMMDYLFAPFDQRLPFAGLLIPSMMVEQDGFAYDQQNSNLVTVKSFGFEQSRRIKISEVHYLDHPYLGMIITINRVKESEVL